MYIYIGIHTHIHTHTHTNTRTRAYVCKHTRVYLHAAPPQDCVPPHTALHTLPQKAAVFFKSSASFSVHYILDVDELTYKISTSKLMHIYMYTYIYTYIYMYIHIYIYVYIHVIYTYLAMS